jgi:hypothetical protein
MILGIKNMDKKDQVITDYIEGESIIITAESQQEYRDKLRKATNDFKKDGWYFCNTIERPLIAVEVSPIYGRKSS